MLVIILGAVDTVVSRVHVWRSLYSGSRIWKIKTKTNKWLQVLRSAVRKDIIVVFSRERQRHLILTRVVGTGFPEKRAFWIENWWEGNSCVSGQKACKEKGQWVQMPKEQSKFGKYNRFHGWLMKICLITLVISVHYKTLYINGMVHQVWGTSWLRVLNYIMLGYWKKY